MPCYGRRYPAQIHSLRNQMNDPNLPTHADRLRSQVNAIRPSSTVQQFIERCGLASWDAAMSTTGFSAYTWWIGDGYGLHACFADDLYTTTNRFGPCGISHNGEFVWKLSQIEDNWNTIRGTIVKELAAESYPDTENAG